MFTSCYVHVFDKCRNLIYITERYILLLWKCCLWTWPVSKLYVENLNKFIGSFYLMWSRDSVVGIATGCGQDNQGVRVPIPSKVKNFLVSKLSRPALGPTQPPIQWVAGAVSPGVKWQGHKADHSPPASAKVKKMWIYTSTPLYTFVV
jgi:hypothetical protein